MNPEINEPTHPNLSRPDAKSELGIYVHAIEDDLLNIVQNEILPKVSPDPDWLYIESKETRLRAIREFNEEYPGENHRDNLERSLECLNFADPFFILRTHKTLLPESIRREMELIKIDFQELLIDVRNRACHARKRLLAGQYTRTIDFVIGAITRDKDIWETLHSKYNASPGELRELIAAGKEPDEDINPVLTNLPVPIHNETGFIGRRKIIDQIRKKFKRVNVVSILGEGGVGKTALAQEIGHQYYEEEGPFEQILYVSLKTQALDLEGRKQLRDEIPTMQTAGLEISQETWGDSEDILTDILSAVPSLLIIDNLETTPAIEAIEELEELQAIRAEDGGPNTKILITSRWGLQQLEAPVRISNLDRKEATKLFREMLKVRQISGLAEKDDKELGEIVDKLNCHPLTMWFVASCLERGTPLTEIINNRLHEVIDYCVKDSISAITQEENIILRMIQKIGTASLVQIRTGLETIMGENINQDKLMITLQKLKNMSLLDYEYGANITEKFRVTSNVAQFFLQNPPGEEIATKLSRAMNILVETPYNPMTKESKDPLDLNFLDLHTKEQALFAQRLHAILKKTKIYGRQKKLLSEMSGIRDQIDQLKQESNGTYAEVFRISAFLEALVDRQSYRADQDYQKAMALTEGRDLRVMFFYGGFLYRGDRFVEAEKIIAKAYDKNASHPGIVSLYSNILFNMRREEEAIAILKKNIQELDEKEFSNKELTKQIHVFLSKAVEYPLKHEINYRYFEENESFNRYIPINPDPLILERVEKEIHWVSNPDWSRRWDNTSINEYIGWILKFAVCAGEYRKTLTVEYEIPLFLEALSKFPKKLFPSRVAILRATARHYGMQDLLGCLDSLFPVLKGSVLTYYKETSKHGFITYEKPDGKEERLWFKAYVFPKEDQDKLKVGDLVTFTISDFIPGEGDIRKVDRAERIGSP